MGRAPARSPQRLVKPLCLGAGWPTLASVSRASRDGSLGSPPPSPHEIPPSMSSSGPCPLLLERVPPAGHQCPNAAYGGPMHHTTASQGTLKYFLMLLLWNISEAGIKLKKKKNPCTITQLQNLQTFYSSYFFPHSLHTHFAF